MKGWTEPSRWRPPRGLGRFYRLPDGLPPGVFGISVPPGAGLLGTLPGVLSDGEDGGDAEGVRSPLGFVPIPPL